MGISWACLRALILQPDGRDIEVDREAPLYDEHILNLGQSMISDHFAKVDVMSNRKLFLVAGALIIFCQLAAMALVAGNQVEKAQFRQAEVASQRSLFTQCLAAIGSPSRQACALQANAQRRTGAMRVESPTGASSISLNPSALAAVAAESASPDSGLKGRRLQQIASSQLDATPRLDASRGVVSVAFNR